MIIIPLMLQLLILLTLSVLLHSFFISPSSQHFGYRKYYKNVCNTNDDTKTCIRYSTSTSSLNLSSSTPSSPSSQSSSLPKVSDMKASELRKELQSYGISTKSFFEKSELVDAVEKARSEGMEPIEKESVGTSSTDTTDSSKDSNKSRDEKIKDEMEKCKKMKVGELKKELESIGVSTKSFFEKSEFVRAVAEARVDGVKNKRKASRSKSSRDEAYDSSYRDVTMQKMDPRTLGMSPVIDIRLAN